MAPPRRAAACGSWASPLSAERAVAAAVGLSDLSFDGERLLWQELRPAEQGRSIVVGCTAGTANA